MVVSWHPGSSSTHCHCSVPSRLLAYPRVLFVLCAVLVVVFWNQSCQLKTCRFGRGSAVHSVLAFCCFGFPHFSLPSTAVVICHVSDIGFSWWRWVWQRFLSIGIYLQLHHFFLGQFRFSLFFCWRCFAYIWSLWWALWLIDVSTSGTCFPPYYASRWI